MSVTGVDALSSLPDPVVIGTELVSLEIDTVPSSGGGVRLGSSERSLEKALHFRSLPTRTTTCRTGVTLGASIVCAHVRRHQLDFAVIDKTAVRAH